MTRFMPALMWVFAAFLIYLGAGTLLFGQAALDLFGHPQSSLAEAFGGRYLVMAAIVIAFLIFRDWRAIGIVMAAGAAMGCLDLILVGKATGFAPLNVAIHAVAAAGALALSMGAFSLRRLTGAL